MFSIYIGYNSVGRGDFYKTTVRTSSDSKILQSLLPSLAEFSNELITPPFIIVGSNLAFAKIEAISDVVVVLP